MGDRAEIMAIIAAYLLLWGLLRSRSRAMRTFMDTFIVLFLVGQVTGYGLNVTALKVHSVTRATDGTYHSTYSLISTIIPVIIAAIWSFRLNTRRHSP